MKKFFFILIGLTALTACTNRSSDDYGAGSQYNTTTGPSSDHEVRYSGDGKDSVVYVQNNNGMSTSGFFMNYLLFRTLFGNGGYTNVQNYYQNHPTEFNNEKQYSSYRERTPRITTKAPTKTYSSPSRSTTKSNYSSPSRSSGSSYTSPSRSSSSKSSYSSPSRSYSSPSRSYSSPSRSYSSPSRSYSSPSRR